MQTMTRIPLRVLAGAMGAMALLCACSDSASTSTKLGDLGRGRFKYACVSTFGDDSACAPKTSETFDFPSSIAVGGSFKLAYEADENTKQLIGNPVLKPAANDFLSDEAPGLFLAKKPGRVAVVARSSSNGKAADFTYLRIALPTELKLRTLEGPTPPPTISVKKGDEPLTLRAEAYSGSSGTAKDILAGTIDFTWTSSTDAIKLLDGSPATRMRFEANPTATSTTSVLTATLGDKSVTVTIEVTP